MTEENQSFKKARENQENTPLFEAPDRKILAVGDMFRGPYTGITSDIDLNNPGRKLTVEEKDMD